MTEHKEVIVVGAGQAGLAVGYHLKQQGCDFVILDAAAEPAAAWRSRWESLRLFTPARYDGLPGSPFPGDPDAYPTRDEVVDYLTGYVQQFELPVGLNSRVHDLRRSAHGYTVQLADRTYTADQVVVATGPFQRPRVPTALAEGLNDLVVQVHSSEYRRPEDLPKGRVLVVGGGNSGYQIAEELAGDPAREVHLAVGSDQKPLPRRILGRELFRVLDGSGLMNKPAGTRVGRWFKGRDTLIGSSPRTARRQGITLHGRAQSSAGSQVALADGSILTVDAVVWATGYAADHTWVDVPVFDDAGAVVHTRGITASAGLYFIGLPWMHTRGSALLGWVKHDAAHVAAQVTSLAPRLRTARSESSRDSVLA